MEYVLIISFIFTFVVCIYVVFKLIRPKCSFGDILEEVVMNQFVVVLSLLYQTHFWFNYFQII